MWSAQVGTKVCRRNGAGYFDFRIPEQTGLWGSKPSSQRWPRSSE